MPVISSSKKGIVFIVALTLFFTAVFTLLKNEEDTIWAHNPNKQRKVESSTLLPNLANTLAGYKLTSLDSMRSAFKIAINENRISLADFEKLDFSSPNSQSFGKNRDYEVFNPEGKRHILTSFEAINKDIPQMTTTDNVNIFFNLRRSTHDEYINDWLYLIIPNMQKSVCEVDAPVKKLTSAIMLAKDNHSVVIDPKEIELGGCIETTDGEFYFFGGIANRMKPIGDETWTQ